MQKHRFLVVALVMAAALIHSAAMAAPSELILGQSKIIVPQGALVGVQVDRVIRDVSLPEGSKAGKDVYPFRQPLGKDDLVPYMEGRLTGNLMDFAKVKVVGLTPAYAKFNPDDGHFMADDGTGNFRFRVDPSKIDYISAALTKDKAFALLPDTHGFNMVAGPAMRLAQQGKRPNLIIACMDLPAKAEAALYLAQNGFSCYGPCDRFGADLLGYKKDNPGSATIIGTAPIRKLKKGGAVIGNQPVTISLKEQIVAQTTDKGYPDQYCDTPGRYFRALSKKLGVEMQVHEFHASVGETNQLIGAANEIGAKVIGVRVHNEKDAEPVIAWLKENPKNRAILFHSAPYEPGYDLFFQFPKQTSFGDLNPTIR